MRIIYNAKRSPTSDDTEGHIRHALQGMGHQVVGGGDGDIYLYHKLFDPPPDFTGRKVMWYFDKVVFGNRREDSFLKLASHADKIFMTDGSYAPKVGATVLRQGIGEEVEVRSVRFDIKEGIGFVGSVYGDRAQLIMDLSLRYGPNFGVFEGYYGRDLYDLCASLEILIAPDYPLEAGYWSNRVYLTLGSGGFLIHPYVKGIEEEYEEGKEIVLYRDRAELIELIDRYLADDTGREKIRRAGYERTVRDYTFTKRLQTMLSML